MSRKKSTTAPAPEAEASAPESTETTPYEPDTILVGRLCADPVLRHTKSALPVATIRIAVNDGPEPAFHNVVCWGRTAEVVCQYKRKGHLVQVQGRSKDHAWQARDGSERHDAEIAAYRVQFLSGRGSSPVAEEELS